MFYVERQLAMIKFSNSFVMSQHIG